MSAGLPTGTAIVGVFKFRLCAKPMVECVPFRFSLFFPMFLGQGSDGVVIQRKVWSFHVVYYFEQFEGAS